MNKQSKQGWGVQKHNGINAGNVPHRQHSRRDHHRRLHGQKYKNLVRARARAGERTKEGKGEGREEEREGDGERETDNLVW